MKTLTILLILFVNIAIGQNKYFTTSNEFRNIIIGAEIGAVVTDSIIWKLQTVDNIGDSSCQHQWVYEGNRKDGMNVVIGRCAVYHNGFHCSYDDRIRGQICKNCLRKETWREQWYQHRDIPPKSKSEYEILNEKLK